MRFPLPWFGQRCISPGLYRECVSDINGRFFSRLHQAGVYTVLHTCGGYGDRLDLLLQEPASAWHIEEPDTAQVWRKYGGKVTLMGNVPSCAVLLNGRPEEVYCRAYADCLAGAREGCFILSADCDVPPGTKEKIYWQWCKQQKMLSVCCGGGNDK